MLQDIHTSVFVHETAQIYGKVAIGAGSSVWPNAVIRSENEHVSIGRMSNIQDFVMLHVGYEHPVVVGDFCSITHRVTLHGCTVGDHCLIGIGAMIMDGAEIGAGSIVGGGTFIPEGKIFPPNSIIMGSPGKVVAERDNARANRFNAWAYHLNGQNYPKGEHRGWDGPEATAYLDDIRTAIETDADLDRAPQ